MTGTIGIGPVPFSGIVAIIRTADAAKEENTSTQEVQAEDSLQAESVYRFDIDRVVGSCGFAFGLDRN